MSFVNKIIHGNSLEILKQLADESVDFVFTDPPFFISKEIAIHRSFNCKYKGKDISLYFGDWDNQWKTKEEYIEWCKGWLKECVRVLKNYRHMVFFFDPFKISYLIDYLEGMGMKARTPLYWIKKNPVPQARCVSMMSAVEAMYWFTKGKVKRDFYNWQLGQHPNYIICSIPRGEKGKRHPTQKPLEVAKWVISYLSKPGDIVLDPFCGSGNFLVAAKMLGRNFIGIEVVSDFYEMAKDRVGKTIDFLRFL